MSQTISVLTLVMFSPGTQFLLIMIIDLWFVGVNPHGLAEESISFLPPAQLRGYFLFTEIVSNVSEHILTKVYVPFSAYLMVLLLEFPG